MKKKIELLFCFCIFVCGTLFTSCSSDVDEQSSTTNQEQKIRDEILEYAQDFDVNIHLKDNISYSNLSSNEIDSLKNMIKSFSSIKGTFKLVQSKKNGMYCAELKNVPTSHSLTRGSSLESASFGHEYDCGGPGGYVFVCSYTVYWTLCSDGRIDNVDESGSIECNRYSGYSNLSTQRCNYGYSVTLRGTISFDCERAWCNFDASYTGSIIGNQCEVTF
jgi:hypothetical protein